MSRPLQKEDHVDLYWQGKKTHGRICEMVPPNCAKVYVIPQKMYVLLKLDQLTLRVCEGPRKHNTPEQEELF